MYGQEEILIDLGEGVLNLIRRGAGAEDRDVNGLFVDVLLQGVGACGCWEEDSSRFTFLGGDSGTSATSGRRQSTDSISFDGVKCQLLEFR